MPHFAQDHSQRQRLFLDSSTPYQGEYTDPDTGKVNMHARWYRPGTGAFVGRSPLNVDTLETGS